MVQPLNSKLNHYRRFYYSNKTTDIYTDQDLAEEAVVELKSNLNVIQHQTNSV